MTANPCINCNHLRKDHRWFLGDWSCLACLRADARENECVCYVPTHIRCTCGETIDIVREDAAAEAVYQEMLDHPESVVDAQDLF